MTCRITGQVGIDTALSRETPEPLIPKGDFPFRVLGRVREFRVARPRGEGPTLSVGPRASGLRAWNLGLGVRLLGHTG